MPGPEPADPDLDRELIDAAAAARDSAYAPYSRYAVGAALRDEEGRVHIGCNVENVSYGGTICAERHAIGAMAAAGGRRIIALAVATLDGGVPCGICLQSLSEFAAGDVPIAAVDEAGGVTRYTLAQLLPHAFASDAVRYD